ncbi:hypothetical protein FACS1894164_21200 [Spirochaetia bacterium]|nr:hypothetical protein FACS1894164_21200 [Spirochaetia bacterium]
MKNVVPVLMVLMLSSCLNIKPNVFDTSLSPDQTAYVVFNFDVTQFNGSPVVWTYDDTNKGVAQIPLGEARIVCNAKDAIPGLDPDAVEPGRITTWEATNAEFTYTFDEPGDYTTKSGVAYAVVFDQHPDAGAGKWGLTIYRFDMSDRGIYTTCQYCHQH